MKSRDKLSISNVWEHCRLFCRALHFKGDGGGSAGFTSRTGVVETRRSCWEGRTVLELTGLSHLEGTVSNYISPSGSFMFVSLLFFNFLNILFSAPI